MELQSVPKYMYFYPQRKLNNVENSRDPSQPQPVRLHDLYFKDWKCFLLVFWVIHGALHQEGK